MKNREKKAFNLFILVMYSIYLLLARENFINGKWFLFALDCGVVILSFIVIFMEMSHD